MPSKLILNSLCSLTGLELLVIILCLPRAEIACVHSHSDDTLLCSTCDCRFRRRNYFSQIHTNSFCLTFKVSLTLTGISVPILCGHSDDRQS